jgi:AcrB/AcrD/AcrF family
MIQRLVAAALRMPFVVISVVVVIIIAGLGAYRALDIEAYPNPVPPLVEVITQPPGWSAEEVERYVTIPLEIGLSGMPGLDHVRSQSIFGLSDVKCYFRWGNDYKDVRQEVINRIQFVTLPAGLQGQLSGGSQRFRPRWVRGGRASADHRHTKRDDGVLSRRPGVLSSSSSLTTCASSTPTGARHRPSSRSSQPSAAHARTVAGTTQAS